MQIFFLHCMHNIPLLIVYDVELLLRKGNLFGQGWGGGGGGERGGRVEGEGLENLVHGVWGYTWLPPFK